MDLRDRLDTIDDAVSPPPMVDYDYDLGNSVLSRAYTKIRTRNNVFVGLTPIPKVLVKPTRQWIGGQCPMGVKLTLKPTCSVRSRMFIAKAGWQ